MREEVRSSTTAATIWKIATFSSSDHVRGHDESQGQSSLIPCPLGHSHKKGAVTFGGAKDDAPGEPAARSSTSVALLLGLHVAC
jgi:hypothetical protein